MATNDWSDDIDAILNNIRLNCIILSKLHKQRYFELKSTLKYYRLPLIILNGFNSIIAVGLQPYADQGTIRAFFWYSIKIRSRLNLSKGLLFIINRHF